MAAKPLPQVPLIPKVLTPEDMDRAVRILQEYLQQLKRDLEGRLA